MPVESAIGGPALSPPEQIPDDRRRRTDRPRRRPSIRGRLRRLVILSVGIALACSALLSVWQATRTYLVDKREALLATANIIAGSSSRAVAAGYEVLLRDSLRPVARLPGVSYARIEGADGRVLGETGGTVRLSSELALDQTESDSVYAFLRTRTVQVSVPIIYAGAPVGRVTLVSSTGDLAARFLGVFVIASLGAVIATGIGLLIAYRLQRSITSPLATLAEEMARIARTQDYDALVPPTSDLETEQLAGSFKQMIGEIQKSAAALLDREAELIFRLSRATEKRDNETGGHIIRMAKLCGLVAEAQGLDRSEVDAIQRVAPLHDVGKIGVLDAIMFKPGKLDAAERREMEKHTTYGYEILRDSKSDLVLMAAEMAWSHHERWDGSGYPRGLKGNAIPLVGRIAAVADVTDALASRRPYKPAWSLDAVHAHLVENSGTQFDPACVEALVKQWDAVEELYATSAETDDLQLAS